MSLQGRDPFQELYEETSENIKRLTEIQLRNKKREMENVTFAFPISRFGCRSVKKS
jgi:hypothetical protein